jgi:hypothetical protein
MCTCNLNEMFTESKVTNIPVMLPCNAYFIYIARRSTL